MKKIFADLKVGDKFIVPGEMANDGLIVFEKSIPAPNEVNARMIENNAPFEFKHDTNVLKLFM